MELHGRLLEYRLRQISLHVISDTLQGKPLAVIYHRHGLRSRDHSTCERPSNLGIRVGVLLKKL